MVTQIYHSNQADFNERHPEPGQDGEDNRHSSRHDLRKEGDQHPFPDPEPSRSKYRHEPEYVRKGQGSAQKKNVFPGDREYGIDEEVKS